MENFYVEELQKKFMQKRFFAKDKAKNNLNIALNNPEFKEIYVKKAEIEIEIAKSKALKNLGKIKNLENELLKLNIEINDLLSALKIGSIIPVYECEKCEDTGFIGEEKCDCFKRELSKLIQSKNGLERPNFADFLEATKTAENKPLYAKMQELCNKFKTTKIKNVLFFGYAGTGKTYLSGCMFTEYEKIGLSPIFLSSFDLNTLFLNYHTNFKGNKSVEFGALLSCPILFIDDLGTEPVYKNVTVEYFNAVLANRILNGLTTVITTNLSLDNILKRYGERFFSRITDKNNSLNISFKTTDLRHKNN